MLDGTCADCAPYERTQDPEGKVCGPDTCKHREKLRADGTCKLCPDYYLLNEDGKGCYKQTCKDRKKRI